MKNIYDSLDIRILNVLRDDATVGYNEISKKVKSPPTTVFQRVKRMKDREIIKKIVPLIDHEKLDYKMTAFIFIAITDIKELDRIAKELSKLDEVLDVHHVSGDNDIMLKIKVKGSNELKDFEVEKVGAIRGIRSVSTVLSLGIFKEEHAIKLRA
ncbi:MAG: Lrp/AsnC family transcriptional regulator [Thermoplasmatales archaeon]